MSDIVEEAKEYCVQARLDYEGHRILNKLITEVEQFRSLIKEFEEDIKAGEHNPLKNFRIGRGPY